MMELAFNVSTDKEKRENATITLLILVHWRTAYEIFIKEVGEYDEVICNAIRVVGKSCENNVSRTKSSMINVVLPWYMEMINSTSMESVNVSYLQNVLNTYSGMNDAADSKPDEALSKGHEQEINTFLSNLLDKIRNETTTDIARDTLIEFITHNIHYTALDWAKRLFEIRGLQKLMAVASKMVEFKNKISINITSFTQTLINMYLTEMYEKMICNDDDKKTFINAIDEFIGYKLLKSDTESKVRIVLAITTLIFSPLDVAKVESIVADVLPWCLEMMNSTCTERVNASQYCLQIILNTYSGMNDESDSKPDEALCKMHKKVIDEILSCLLDKIKSKTTTGIARDALIEFITRNIHYTALDWAKQLIEFGGLKTLMEVASQCQSEYCNSLDITSSTQTITSVCLAKIDENLDENDKEDFFNIINEFIREELNSTDVGCHVNAIVAMITLTFGPFNVANTIITKDAFYMIIVDFWDKNDLLLRKVICEFIYVIVIKYDEFITFIRESLPILGKLFYIAADPNVSEDLDNFQKWRSFNSIQIRAFVNLCSMTKFEEIKYFPFGYMFDDGTQILEAPPICEWFLINQRDMRKWAVAGLSYFTFNIGVKKKLIENRKAVQAIIEFAKTENESILYQVDILLVNLCSAYDREDLIPKMEMFVNYFDVKNQILAEDNYVGERRRVLAHASVTSALVSLAKMNSPNSKELIARVFNAICSQQELREIVVEEGGTETLLSLALDGTDKGKKYASRALVHLALTIDLEVAFPGQLIMKVVQPIVDLLSSECSVNERYEALTALYNLASVDNSMRLHIFTTKYEKIERCMCENDNLLKRTSIQLTNNLVSCREVAFQLVEQRSDQLRDLMMGSIVDDTDDYIIHTKKAAAGMFVTLTATSKEACVKLLSLIIWPMFLGFLLNNGNDDLQHKGIKIALNMMRSTKDVAEKLIEMDTIMRQVRALSNNDTMQNKEIKKLASLVLEAAAEWDTIEGNVEGNESSDSTDNTD
ncbi:protein unc-45 homolog B-like [Temnothorax nylanderi]|uniref:protein unc-45 homolog B-like n=1 Tax=Temnothorax nylanderi TaxID=102681 RepID=UPI003A8A4F55